MGVRSAVGELPDPDYLTKVSIGERVARGRGMRQELPHERPAGWVPSTDRSDTVPTLQRQAGERIAELVPIRYGRMVASAFAFFRGGAAVMAADLCTTPTSGLRAQLCGDAHLLNFGIFDTPERALVFGLNDFDETLPGPIEWDVKRLASSVEVARSADRIAIAAYLGEDDGFERAIAEFASTYAAVNEQDHALLAHEIEQGRVLATTGL